MSEHTKEPWCVSTERPNIIKVDFSGIGSDHGPLIGSTCGHPSSGFFPDDAEAKANALRIVACVNACAGMADPAAEIAALKREIEAGRNRLENLREAARKEIATLRQQRDGFRLALAWATPLARGFLDRELAEGAVNLGADLTKLREAEKMLEQGL